VSSAQPHGLRRRLDDGERSFSRAFGIDLDLGFPVHGLPSRAGEAPSDPTRVDLVEPEAIDEAWPSDARRVGIMGPADEPVMEVDEHFSAGYRISLPPYGRYLVSGDGRHVACAPPPVASWEWQRLLIGQVLPAAAAVRDLELLHASAVTIGDRAVAFAGLPGLGKSSLALRLMLRGHRLMAEDVLAIETRDGGIEAEPGASMLNVREDEFASLTAAERERAGDEVGASHGKVHVVAGRDDRTLPLAVLYLLDRGDTSEPMFEPIEDLRAADLFANSFVIYVHRTGRMIRQLDIASVLARTVPVIRLRVQPGVTADELAAAVEEDVS
jgi:hypothetical protein